MASDLAIQEAVIDPDEIVERVKELHRDIQALIEIEPIEDGIRHPIERRLKDELIGNPVIAPNVIQHLFDEWRERPVLASALLRCVGRCDFSVVGRWGVALASDALSHRNVEVRDAAVSALELWGGEEARQVLQASTEQEPVPYLASYMKQVVQDLSKQ
ncbi:MAG: hypothetical protein ACREEM_36125 [Blastocatellia bacterium]